MRKFLCLATVLFYSLTAFAQIQSAINESLLNIAHRNQPSTAVYNGTPIVKIESTVGAPKPERASGWMDAEKKRLFGTTQITQDSFFNQTVAAAPAPIQTTPEIQYISPNKQVISGIYTPHTTDFISLIQVIDNETLLIEELIQTVNPKSSLFSRVLASDSNQAFTPTSFQLLKAERNGKPFALDIEQSEKEIKLTHADYLEAGVQSYHLKYIIRSGISVQKENGVIDYSITGFNWPLPINRFTVLVSFPNQVKTEIQEIVFGANEVAIKDAFSSQTDTNGNTIYRTNNPLPAYANVKIYQTFKGNIISDNAFERFLNTYMPWLTVLALIASVIIYLIISLIYLRFKKPEKNILQFIQTFSPLTLSYLISKNISKEFIQKLIVFYSYISNRKTAKLYQCLNIFLRIYGVKRLLYFGLYLRLSFKYWITGILMMGGMIYLAATQNIYLTGLQYSITFFISAISIYLFFRFYGAADLMKEVKRYRQKVMNENTFYGLSGQSVLNLFTRYYPRLTAIDAEKEWIEISKKHNHKINELPFIQSQGGENEKSL